MRKFYTLCCFILIVLVYPSCSKDILKPYDDRIIGAWKITDIDKFGIGGSGNIMFPENSEFSFSDNGQLIHSYSGQTYTGSWNIRKERREDDYVNTLHLTAIDFTNQNVRTESFSEMSFTSTNRFKAFIYTGTRTYVYHFERQ